MRTVLLILVVSIPSVLFAQLGGEEAVETVLDDQVAAWNNGDIEGYMRGYWNSDETIFVSGGTVVHGYNRVLSRYRKNYDSLEKMGRLSFDELQIRMMSPTTAVATGKWELKRSSDNPGGRFTLLLEMKPEGWRIVYDHTSSGSE